MEILKHIILFLFLITSVKCNGICVHGNITEDIDIEVEDTLTISCALFTSPITYENKTYAVSSGDLRLKFEKDFLDVDVVNGLAIQYSVQNATVNDSGGYSCYVVLPGINKNLFICSTRAAVGYKPLPVSNFSCISYGFANLTCTWERPFNPVHTDYKLWDYLRLESLKRPCPEVLNDTSCRWTLHTQPQYYRSARKIYFLMMANNSLGSLKQRMSEDHYKIVKPGVPRNIRFTNETRTSVVIHWTAPHQMEYGFPPGLQYQILYKSISTPNPNPEVTSLLLPVEDPNKSSGSQIIENLIPNTEYKFLVRCRSGVVDHDDLWSEEASASVGTYPDVPYLAPETTYSSFDVERILGNRTITLYWKGIPADFENGDGFHYVVQYHIHHVPSRTVRSNHAVNVGNRTFYSVPHLDTHSAYLFKIFAANSIGPSYNGSEIVVDKSERLLEAPKDIIVVSYGQGKYNLSWKASNQRPYNFTIFWCQSLYQRPFKCDGSLEWAHTTKNKYVLQLPDKNSNYQFAVSANDDIYTSGMTWASCIVYYKGANYKVKRIEMMPKNATSLKVQWSLDCEAQKIVMKEYAIQYCEFQGSCAQTLSAKSCNSWRTVNVSDVYRDDYIIGSLKPYTRYLVFMRVHTLNGWSGNSNLACEMTLSTAPSDAPRNVTVSKVEGKDISISFKPPQIPNGIVTRYLVYYSKMDGITHHHEFRVKGTPLEWYTVRLSESLMFYSNYSIELEACVDQACSKKSDPVYAFTSIDTPGIMNSPRIEVLENLINISWTDPVISNGPLNYFQVLRENNDSVSIVTQVFNVSGQNYLLLKHNCSENEEDKMVYHFRVRAVNMKEDGMPLYGPYSEQTKTMLCSTDTPIGVIVGIAVGATVGAIVFTLLLYSLYCWMRHQVDLIKGITVQLPKDLDSPMENPLSSYDYDKFKNGLQTNHDAGIPCDTSYERLCAFASEDVKELGRVIDEKTQKTKRKSSGRNNSGESTASGKCHDSISSSNTTKTHLSIDSGAEVDSPPSPDGLFSDTSSSHTTPRSYKPDLTIVQERNGSTSKDSGLDKEGNCSFLNQHIDIPSKFSYFVKKKNFPYPTIPIPTGDARMPSYSKFSVLNASNSPSFVPYGEQNLGLFESSLSNSEPSVAEFDVESSSEPLVPYCKFGLARSAGNGLNVSSQPVIVNNNNVGYCKFGTVYRAVKRPDVGSTPLNTSLHACPKFWQPHNPQTFTALTTHNFHPGKFLPIKDNDKAYSKFGVASKKVPVSGYVSYRDTLSYPPAETHSANHAYSKLGVGAAADPHTIPESEAESKESRIVINPAELPMLSSRNSYVPFRNAKIMNSGDSPKESFINEPLSKEESVSMNGLLHREGIVTESHDSSSKERESGEVEVENHELLADNVISGDIDCIIATDTSPSLLDEITSDLGSKLTPTNFTISTNNDSKGFLLQENTPDPPSQLTSIMDALFSSFGVSGNSDIEPICINLDDIDVANPSACNNNNVDDSSSSDLNAVESKNLCKECNNQMSECSCSSMPQVGVICNGHSSPLGRDYVPLSLNSTC